MPKSPLDSAIDIAVKKDVLLKNKPLQFLVKAALAGVYIGFAVVFSFTVGEYFRSAGSPAISFMAGVAFSLALILIVIGNGELFTGNTMYFTMSTLKRKTTINGLVQNWIATYIGNLIGVVFFVYLVIQSGVFSQIGLDYYLLTTAVKKVDHSTTELFFRGILCNWLICLAIWIPMQTKDYIAKVILIMFIVTAFFVSGFEHSIANMAIFSFALSLPHAAEVTLLNTLHNLIPVTLGNVVGGGFFVGAVYVYINREVKSISDNEKQNEVVNMKQSI
ncbi:formate/nitrite transporter family protein [Caldibacillus lycopersici]|uniref:Formate/nitrite transporter family protein n=1 Tax=Perspicuibacillus lycopersici TaxID=1325689 RepID=A0AAE3IQX2_9BACI|nr:formate/nitrite transporter family protein [Perspicuibacillus lycopersici]MCU9612935.1 formate/nitrite transporter family protein [Perspicuibacillus lycopersici]